MIQKTKGQLESEISVEITKFEKEHFGRGPQEVRTFIIQDMILIRLKGILTPAEISLASTEEGIQLVKQLRRRLIESSRGLIEKIIEEKVNSKIVTLHTDISVRRGERVIVIGLDRNLEEEL